MSLSPLVICIACIFLILHWPVVNSVPCWRTNCSLSQPLLSACLLKCMHYRVAAELEECWVRSFWSSPRYAVCSDIKQFLKSFTSVFPWVCWVFLGSSQLNCNGDVEGAVGWQSCALNVNWRPSSSVNCPAGMCWKPPKILLLLGPSTFHRPTWGTSAGKSFSGSLTFLFLQTSSLSGQLPVTLACMRFSPPFSSQDLRDGFLVRQIVGHAGRAVFLP